MSIITYTRERRCKDCINLRYYRPNPSKFYRRHKCIEFDTPETLESKTAVNCEKFIWNPMAIPYSVD